MLPDIRIFHTLFLCKLTLNWLDIISIEKNMADSDDLIDRTFSVVYSLLEIKSEAYKFENIFKIIWNM